jgi:L-iditol 2-dehydrogenase
VICVDLLPDRLERAVALGARTAFQAQPADRDTIAAQVMAALDGSGAEFVFECAGADETLWNMCEIAAPAGHVMVIGTNPDDRVAFCSSTARRKGLTIRMVRRSLNTLPDCLRMVQDGEVKPDALVTHIFSAGEIDHAFRVVENHEDGVLKAVLNMVDW